jgi:hypothetical protein
MNMNHARARARKGADCSMREELSWVKRRYLEKALPDLIMAIIALLVTCHLSLYPRLRKNRIIKPIPFCAKGKKR